MEEDGNNGRGDSVGGLGITSEDEAGRSSPLLLVAPDSMEDEAEAAAATSSSTLPASSSPTAPRLTANLAEEAAVPSSPLPPSISAAAPLLTAGLLGVPRDDPTCAVWDWAALVHLMPMGQVGEGDRRRGWTVHAMWWWQRRVGIAK